MKGLQATWGSAWPEVWKDLTTVGKLPAAYQMVGALENEGDGALLARALGQANKEGVNKPLDDLIDRGATGASRPSQVVRTRVEGSQAVQDYRSSMLASGASPEQVDGIVSSIGFSGRPKFSTTTKTLQRPATKLYRARSGSGISCRTVALASREQMPMRLRKCAARGRQDCRSLPCGLPRSILSRGQAPGAATADDWLRVLRAAPNWVTVGQSIRLMDNGGRFVRAANGGFVEVPFNVQAAAATTAGTASPPVNVPPY